MKLSFFSPAKINLFLLVLGKREDGYHEIASLMQAISLYDELHFELGNKDVLLSSDPSLDIGPSNLIWKAVLAFREKTSIREPLTITLKKNIPMMSGLGGGSSNAATTLFALDSIFSTNFSQEDFFSLAQKIGSDVPFFFSQGTAYVEGRGEKVEEIFLPIAHSFYLFFSKEGLSTAHVYQAMKGKIDVHQNPRALLKRFLAHDFSYQNDLEKGAFSICQSLANNKKELEESNFSSVFLTGSGSAFVCVGENHRGLSLTEVKAIQRKEKLWYSP
ncbi:MAG: 4-(cytidine 5'-diphospho)-2-C-methyl-D-erythritol kinase [Chlamydiota bacterium]